jgi:uncharacterized protein (TIGR02118 family)
MYKLSILFRAPADIPRFEHDWAHTFVPLAEAMPGILRVAVSNIDGGPDGPAPFYKSHEFYFESRAAMDTAMNSESGVRAGYALNQFAPGLFTILFCEVLEDIVRESGRPPALTPTPPPSAIARMGEGQGEGV